MLCAVLPTWESVEYVAPFREGARVLVVGSSGTGKSSFISKLVLARKDMFEIPPKRVLFCTHSGTRDLQSEKLLQERDDNGHQLVQFINEVPGDEHTFEPYTMLIFDDLLSGPDSDVFAAQIVPYFSRRAHHEKLYCFVTAQSLYSPSRHFRHLSLNANYLLLFKTQRSLQQIRHLAQQVLGAGSAKDVVEMYRTATKSGAFSYLIFDWHPQTDERLRYLSNVFEENGEPCTVYMLKE